jgi:hypothetical protein
MNNYFKNFSLTYIFKMRHFQITFLVTFVEFARPNPPPPPPPPVTPGTSVCLCLNKPPLHRDTCGSEATEKEMNLLLPALHLPEGTGGRGGGGGKSKGGRGGGGNHLC